MGTAHNDYDEDGLAMDIAQGQLTYEELAAKYELSVVYVGQISRGEKRPEIKAKVKAIRDGMIEQAKALGARLSSVAMARLGKLVAKDSTAVDDVQRKASVDILKFSLGDPSRPEINVNQNQQNAGPELPDDYGDFMEWKSKKATDGE